MNLWNTHMSMTLLELLVGAPPVKYWLIDDRSRKALNASMASCLDCILSFKSLHICLISSAFNNFAYSSKLKLLMPRGEHQIFFNCLLLYYLSSLYLTSAHYESFQTSFK